jgi:hypothetical protein
MSEEPKKVEQTEADTKSKEVLPEAALDQVVGGVSDVKYVNVLESGARPHE